MFSLKHAVSANLSCTTMYHVSSYVSKDKWSNNSGVRDVEYTLSACVTIDADPYPLRSDPDLFLHIVLGLLIHNAPVY